MRNGFFSNSHAESSKDISLEDIVRKVKTVVETLDRLKGINPEANVPALLEAKKLFSLSTNTLNPAIKPEVKPEIAASPEVSEPRRMAYS